MIVNGDLVCDDPGCGDLALGVAEIEEGSEPSWNDGTAFKNRAGEEGRDILATGEVGISFSSWLVGGANGDVDERGELGPAR